MAHDLTLAMPSLKWQSSDSRERGRSRVRGVGVPGKQNTRTASSSSGHGETAMMSTLHMHDEAMSR